MKGKALLTVSTICYLIKDDKILLIKFNKK